MNDQRLSPEQAAVAAAEFNYVSSYIKENVAMREAILVGVKPVEYFRGVDFRFLVRKEGVNHFRAKTPYIFSSFAGALEQERAKLELLYKRAKQYAESEEGKEKGVVLPADLVNAFETATDIIDKLNSLNKKSVSDDSEGYNNDESIVSAFCLYVGNRMVQNRKLTIGNHSPLGSQSADQSHLHPSLRDSPRFPRRLISAPPNTPYTHEGFFMIEHGAEENKKQFRLLLVAIGILMVGCMFPIWPMFMKYIVWYASVGILAFFAFCTVIRLVLYILVWYAGADFWFLPNLFDEDLGVLESFVPLYSFEKRDDGAYMFITRILALICTAAMFYKVSETHSLKDIADISGRLFLDVVEWGEKKFIVDTDAISNVGGTELNPEEMAWARCARVCEFDDKDELTEFCFEDCGCVNELYESRCWKRCEVFIQDDIMSRNTKCVAEDDETDGWAFEDDIHQQFEMNFDEE